MRRTNISDFINSDDSDPFSAVTVTFKPKDMTSSQQTALALQRRKPELKCLRMYLLLILLCCITGNIRSTKSSPFLVLDISLALNIHCLPWYILV